MTSILVGMLILVSIALRPMVVHAQIATDGSLGPRTLLNGPNFMIGAELGRVRGKNLFHSFDQFNVRTGENATFAGPLWIANILSRVTGGQSSFIDGGLGSSIPGANLFLLNPSGVLFGPHASLNLTGSFHVSTAHYLRLADGVRFYADLGHDDSVLTGAAPAAFGFLGANPNSIAIDRAMLEVANGQLSVVGNIQPLTHGQTLLVAGGDIGITGSTLSAPSGQIHLVAGGASTADLTRADTVLSAPNGLIQLGNVASTGEVPLRPAANPTGRIDITTNARIDVSGDPLSGGAGGTIVIRGSHLLVDHSTLRADTQGAENGLTLGIGVQITDDMTVRNGGDIRTTARGTGSGGDLTIDVGSLSVGSGSQIGTETVSFSRASTGHTTINATGSITISDPSTAIFSNTTIIGAASPEPTGGVSISAGSLALQNRALIQTNRVVSNGGQGADVLLHHIGSLSITGGARIFTNSTGTGGAIVIRDVGSVTLSGPGSGIVTRAIQRAGDISLLDVGSLRLTHRALIEAGDLATLAARGVGNVMVRANDVVISDQAGLLSAAARGDIGAVSITAGTLTMDNGFIAANTVDAGRAGTISVTVDRLSMTHGALIATANTAPRATGSGGDLTITARDSVSLAGGASINSNTIGLGHGGNIELHAGRVRLEDHATISATSSSTGEAGNVTIAARDGVTLRNSAVTTEARTADGGNVQINGGLVYLLNSQITTSVGSGNGRGGNITIDPQFVVLDHSQVRANAFGGPGGNINIASDFFLTNRSEITASSVLSTSGTISVQSRFTDLSTSVAPLPAGLLHAATLLRASCAARVAAGKASSLGVGGREGVPLEPGGYMPSPLMAPEPSGVEPNSSDGAHVESLPRLSLSVFTPACSR